MRRPRPTTGLNPGERRIFWRLLAACGDTHSLDIDIEDHCRNVAKTIVWHQTHPAARRTA